MTALILSVIVLYVTIMVLGIRAGVETYIENKTIAKWYSHLSSAFDHPAIRTKFPRKGEKRQRIDFEGKM
jgi:hypothetical protein